MLQDYLLLFTTHTKAIETAASVDLKTVAANTEKHESSCEIWNTR